MMNVTQPDATVQFDDTLRAPTKPQAYYCHLYDEPGILAKINGVLYFVAAEDSRIVEFDTDMVTFCTVLGAVSISETQHIVDRVAGGPARLCTSRAMERL